MSLALGPTTDDPLQHAIAYATAGIRVLPIKPGHKRPPMQSWQHAATTNPDTIRNWYRGLYGGHGVGLAMGTQPDGRNLFALDIDEHGGASGFDTIAALEHVHGKLPPSVASITGNRGAHVIYDSGPIVVTNGAAGAVGPGVDVRGEGGQIVVAPSVHPNGSPYAWEHGFAPWEHEVAKAPAWLLELVAPPIASDGSHREDLATRIPKSAAYNPDDSPADLLREGWDWPTELQRRGWQQARRPSSNGDTHWTRPGKNPREGASAVLHGGDGPLVVFTTDASTMPMWRAGKQGNGVVSLSPLAYVAAYDHGGDLSAATRALRASQPAASPLGALVAPDTPQSATERRSSLLINWREFWDKDHNSEEWIAWPLIPARRQVALYAPAKTGKSIVTLAACASAATGRSVFGAPPADPIDVLYLDYEMTESDLHERLESLGYGPDVDLTHFHYALLPALPPLNSPEGCHELASLAADVNARAVIIDTMGRAVTGEENSADSYREFARTTGLTLKAAGRAVLRTDHAGKDRDKGQRGSSAKNDDVDVVLRVDVAEGGWTLTRTHARVSWVPEKVLIQRGQDSDGHATFTIDKKADTYEPGTKDRVAQLAELGVTADTTKREALDLLHGAGLKMSNKRVVEALRWMRAEVPTFGDLGGPEGRGPSRGPDLSTGTGPGPRPTGTRTETPRSDGGDHVGDHRGPPLPPTGDQVPPLKGGPGPGHTRTDRQHQPIPAIERTPLL